MTAILVFSILHLATALHYTPRVEFLGCALQTPTISSSIRIVRLSFVLICITLVLLTVNRIVKPEEILAKQNDAVVVATQSGTVDYALAWPGMLPDHPLYKLKVLRDKVVFMLVKNPVKRLEYYLFLADKGMYATKLLVDKGNIPLAKETAYKAEHNYTQLVTEYKWMYWYAKPIPSDLDQKIQIAGLKHQQVLTDIINEVPNQEDKNSFSQVAGFSRANLAELMSLTLDSRKE